MASFKYDNGKAGIEFCRHTTTGYECLANLPGRKIENNDNLESQPMFFARHVVGSDGHPYTEIGITGLSDSERSDSLREIKAKLIDHNFIEVFSLYENNNHPQDKIPFAEHLTPDHGSIALRLAAGKDGISKVIEIVGQLVLDESREFVKEQEQVDDVLFHSILHTLGPELEKGPGGRDYAVKKAHELANALEEGF